MKILGVIGLMTILACFIVYAADTDNTSTTTTNLANSSGSRFESDLPAIFNKDFLNNLPPEQNVTEKFQTDEFSLDYQRIAGRDAHLKWKKGNDSVEMHFRFSDGNVRQIWNLTGGAVNISLIATPPKDKVQNWAFGKYQYSYVKLAKGDFSTSWVAKGIQLGKTKAVDWESSEIYKNLINEWCDKNSFLVKERNKCVIY
ncbi:uncharacterized protein LOC135843590 isoform X2 [Planococcus citri]|uniref:uncharacterized protein LOC135843590 isoform X2 n=1 Tax=Planococcus citri TaxID=170843 RepID=UPI0031F7AC3E